MENVRKDQFDDVHRETADRHAIAVPVYSATNIDLTLYSYCLKHVAFGQLRRRRALVVEANSYL